METKFLGPEGVKERMAEIQARMAAITGRPTRTQAVGGQPFAGTLSGLLNANDATPLNPLSGGIGLKPDQNTMELKRLSADAARANGIDPDLFDCLVTAESDYNPMCRSNAGAMGLSQLMPENAKDLGLTNPFDPTQNLNGGARLLKQLLDKFQDPKLALAAYNAGPGAVHRYGGIPPYKETQNYVAKIMKMYEAKKGVQ